VPKGIYPGEIDTVEFGMSNNSGAPMFTVQIGIADGEYKGRKLYTYLSFSQKALPFTKATIARIAPELLQGPFNPQEIADSGKLLGKPCRIRVNHVDYQGEPRARITQVLAAADAANGGATNGAGGKKDGFF
jgi:hypothetical protein